MRIGIDFRPAQKKNSRRRGLGRYTSELVKAMLADSGFNREMVLYSLDENIPDIPGQYDTRKISSISKPSRLNWLKDRIFLPGTVNADKLDVFQATEINAIPGGAACFVSAVVHDLIPFIFWDETTRSLPPDVIWGLKNARKQIARADLIIADSEHTRKDICSMLKIDSSKVEAVHLGKSDSLQHVPPDQARQELREAGLVSGPFLFYVGGSDYRKNVKKLIGFYSLVKSKGYEGHLVIGGETFLWDIPEVNEIKSLAAKYGLEKDVLFPGYIPDNLLSCYYSGCDYFVFPSLYEGFGLPVLEAMQCGAPLLLSRSSSVPEVAGDFAFYFDPESEDNMLDAFFRAENNQDAVKENVRQGLLRSEQFTWESAAKKIFSLYTKHL